MVYRKDRCSIKINGMELDEAWVRQFDPATPARERAALTIAFREDSEARVAREFGKAGGSAERDFPLNDWWGGYDIHGWQLDRLPQKSIALVVLVGGYKLGLDLVGRLSEKGIVDSFVLAGYTWRGARTFSDGSRMKEKMYMHREDLEFLRMWPSSPLIIIDDRWERNITNAAVGNTLKEVVGHTGPLHNFPGYNYWEDHRYLYGTEWSNKIDVRSEEHRAHLERAASARPLVTEDGEVLLSKAKAVIRN